MTHATVGQAATGLPETISPHTDIDLVHVTMLLNQALLIVRKMLVHADANAAREMLAREAGR